MSLLDAALEWNERGFPVFPLIPNGKKPHPGLPERPPGEGGCYLATFDRKQILAWWMQWPTANLGITCGRVNGHTGPLVLDVDNKHGKDGSGDLQIILAQYGQLPQLPMVLTPTGGYHLYSIYDTRADDKRTGKFFGYDSIDVQGTGCYVVAPPSIIDGKHYVEEVDTGFDDVEMMPLPHWCFAGMADKAPPVEGHSASARSGMPLDVPSLTLRRAMKMVLVAGDVLRQYPSTSEMVQALEKDLIRGGYGDADIVALLMDAGHAGGVKAQAQGERWLLSDISRCRSMVAHDDIAPPVDDAPPLGQPREAVKPDEITAQELLATNFPPIKWFASGLLHEGMVLFGGKSKRGKSWMAMNAAVSMAQGEKVFGHYEVAEPRKVLYAALEDGPRRTQRRLRLMSADPGLTMLHVTFRLPPLSEGGMEYLVRKIQEGYEVIFIDVLAKMEKPGKNGLPNYHEVYQTFAQLQELRSAHQFALVMITHLRKGESEEIFDALHGSVAYQGTQDALWVMDRKHGEDRATVHVRDKDAEDKSIELKFDGEGLWSFVGEGEEHQETTEETAIIEFLRQEVQPQGAKEIMLGLGIHLARYPAIRKRLMRMTNLRMIIRTDRGKYSAMPTYTM